MPKNTIRNTVSGLPENEKHILTELLHILIKTIISEVCHD